jgi:hypothetical protein
MDGGDAVLYDTRAYTAGMITSLTYLELAELVEWYGEPLCPNRAKQKIAALVDALRDYHALMGNVHMVYPGASKEDRRCWMDARYEAQKKAQAALAAVEGEDDASL